LNEPKKYLPFKSSLRPNLFRYNIQTPANPDSFRRVHLDLEIQTFTVLHCLRNGFKTISYVPQEPIILGQIIRFIHQFSSIVSLTGDTEISSNEILLLSLFCMKFL